VSARQLDRLPGGACRPGNWAHGLPVQQDTSGRARGPHRAQESGPGKKAAGKAEKRLIRITCRDLSTIGFAYKGGG